MFTIDNATVFKNERSQLLVKMKKKIDFELGFQTKIGSPLAPLLAPLFQIQKV